MTDDAGDDRPPSTFTLRDRRTAFAAAFCTVAVVLPALHLRTPVHFDEAIFVAVADRVVDGGRLYRDAIDHKPPGVFAVAVAATLLTDATRPVLAAAPGLPGPPALTVTVLRLWTYGAVTLTGLAVAAVGRRGGDAATGTVAGVAYLLVAYLPYFQGYHFLTEPWAALATTVAAVLLLCRRRWADGLAGTALAVGVLFNQAVFLFGLAFVVYLALGARDPDRRSADGVAHGARRLAVVGVGFLVPIGAVLAVFTARGTLAELLYYTLVLPATNYRTPTDPSGRALAAVSLLPVLVLAGVAVGAHARDLLRGRPVDDDLLFVVLWGIAMGYPGATSFGAQHQLLLAFPPLVVLAAVGWQRVAAARPAAGRRDGATRQWPGAPDRSETAAVLLVALVVLTAGFNALLLGALVAGSHVDEQVDETRAVESRVDGPVYTWPPNLYLVVFSEELRYGSRFYMGVYGPTVDGVIADLETREVPYLVVRANHVTGDGRIDPDRVKWFVEDKRPLVAYMNREYAAVDRTEAHVIFRRTDGAAPGARATAEPTTARPTAAPAPR